jgi:pSer/pThr/pTyr-binding forkhead associated (FHA) protein
LNKSIKPDNEGWRRELTSTLNIQSLRAISNGHLESEGDQRLSVEEREIISSLDPGDAMLIILDGPDRGARFLLDRELHKVGRDPTCEIFLDDATVSRAHCLVARTPTGEGIPLFSVKDRQSLNGTYLNGMRVTESELRSGDEIHIGKYRLSFFTKS